MRVDLTKLPVGPEEREFLDGYTERQIGKRVFNLGGIHPKLREDYLNPELPFPDRAVRHFNVTADEWRRLLDIECRRVAAEVASRYYAEDLAVVYPWRAGLAFVPSFIDLDFPHHVHLGISRDENNPTQTARKWLPLDGKLRKSNPSVIVIADIMVATGGSIITTIQEVVGVTGRFPSKIVVASVIGAPEGIWRVLDTCPRIEIVTAVIDGGLNELGYIYLGLGDAGDKFCYNLPLHYFFHYRYAFSATEWNVLRSKCANPYLMG